MGGTFTTNHISNHIIKHYQNFFLISQIVLFNTAVDILHITWVIEKAFGFKSKSNLFTFVDYELILMTLWIFSIQKDFVNIWSVAH